MESQRLLPILLVLTALVRCGWSQFVFGNPPSVSLATGKSSTSFVKNFSLFLGVRLFLGEENITIANFSMIAARQFHDTDQDSPGSPDTDDQNDGLWCQSSLDQSMIGTWYFPNGTDVSRVEVSPLYSNNTPTGQIGLLRNQGIASIQGLYRCVIANEEGVNQTLYVAAYGNGEFDNNGKD